MKTAISIPDQVFREAERAAKRLGVSRSELYTRAVQAYLASRTAQSITASYDAAFGPDPEPELEAFRREAARRRLLGIEWED